MLVFYHIPCLLRHNLTKRTESIFKHLHFLEQKKNTDWEISYLSINIHSVKYIPRLDLPTIFLNLTNSSSQSISNIWRYNLRLCNIFQAISRVQFGAFGKTEVPHNALLSTKKKYFDGESFHGWGEPFKIFLPLFLVRRLFAMFFFLVFP